MVTAYLYDAKGHDREVALEEGVVESLNQHLLLWIDVDGRDAAELTEVGRLLQLEPASVRDLRQPTAQPRLYNYGGYYQITVYVEPHQDAAPAGNGQEGRVRGEGAMRLDLVVGARWIITVRDGDVAFLREFRDQDKAETLIGALTPQALAASLLDWHLEAYFGTVARIEAAIDLIDLRVLARPSGQPLLERMVKLRREVSRLRALLTAQRGVFYGLARPDFALVVESDASAHYQTLVGRFERAVDEVERTRDLVVGSFELFATRTAQETNELVKILTFVTVVIGFCAAVAGLFGMNFSTKVFGGGDMGFYMVIGGLLLFSLAAAIIARVKGWL